MFNLILPPIFAQLNEITPDPGAMSNDCEVRWVSLFHNKMGSIKKTQQNRRKKDPQRPKK